MNRPDFFSPYRSTGNVALGALAGMVRGFVGWTLILGLLVRASVVGGAAIIGTADPGWGPVVWVPSLVGGLYLLIGGGSLLLVMARRVALGRDRDAWIAAYEKGGL